MPSQQKLCPSLLMDVKSYNAQLHPPPAFLFVILLCAPNSLKLCRILGAPKIGDAMNSNSRMLPLEQVCQLLDCSPDR